MKHQTIYEINGADILAFGLNEELVLIGAGDELMEEAKEVSSYAIRGYDDEGGSQTDYEFDSYAVTDYIKQNLYSFADQWIKEGKPTQTQEQYYNN